MPGRRFRCACAAAPCATPCATPCAAPCATPCFAPCFAPCFTPFATPCFAPPRGAATLPTAAFDAAAAATGRAAGLMYLAGTRASMGRGAGVSIVE